MKFKIKDNVKLQLLEEIGFDFNGTDYTINYDDTYIIINKKDRILKLTYLGNIKEFNVLNHNFSIDISVPIILYTLIKLDLLEIV